MVIYSSPLLSQNHDIESISSRTKLKTMIIAAPEDVHSLNLQSLELPSAPASPLQSSSIAMDDLPLQKIQISGPTLASLLQRISSSPGDVDGLLFGRVTYITPTNFSDDDPTTAVSASPSDSPTILATITSFFCSNSTSTFYDSTGQLNDPILSRLLASCGNRNNNSLLGWFSGRRKTHLRPSMRESSVTSSLSSKIQFACPIENSPKSYTLPPCMFLLVTTPMLDQLIHTHEYKAYQFRISSETFEAKTLEVVNIGPAFRGHYGSFSPKSPFPLLPMGMSSMGEEGSESESLKSMKMDMKDQKELDKCARDFEIGRLKKLIAPEAANYSAEVEDLYNKMLAKLDGLSRLVENSTAKVIELENHNLKLSCKVAGLE